jgi:hypothetical protein
MSAYNFWTPAEERLLLGPNVPSDAYLAERLGRTPQAVQAKRLKLQAAAREEALLLPVGTRVSVHPTNTHAQRSISLSGKTGTIERHIRIRSGRAYSVLLDGLPGTRMFFASEVDRVRSTTVTLQQLEKARVVFVGAWTANTPGTRVDAGLRAVLSYTPGTRVDAGLRAVLAYLGIEVAE